MGRPKKKMPDRDELLKFSDRKNAAEHYGVSVRTVVRWLQFYGVYEPKKNFGANKLSLQQANNIREQHAAGWPMKVLANKYHVTFSTISRVVHNITHKDCRHDTSTVSVIYNVYD